MQFLGDQDAICYGQRPAIVRGMDSGRCCTGRDPLKLCKRDYSRG